MSAQYFMTAKMGKRLPFGDAHHACKCPNPECGLLLEWKYEGDGLFTSHCCTIKYEMYCETVTINRVGTTDKPNLRYRSRRRESKVLAGERLPEAVGG